MKFSQPINWSNDFDKDGLLYFAHRLEEMLFHYSIDLYKTQVLNTNQLLNEYVLIQKKLEKDIVKKWHLDVIYKEFENSFRNDIILKEYWGFTNIQLTLKELNSSNEKKKTRIMKYLHSIFRPKYYKWCVDYLKDIIPKQKQKKKIEQVIVCFLPELICRGYSQEYIYKLIDKVFFTNVVKSIDKLDEFLNYFDNSKKKFRIYFDIANIEFKEILEKKVKACFDDDGNFHRFRHNNNIVYLEVEAYERYTAIKKAYSLLNLFIKFYKFIGHNKKNIIGRMGMVLDIKNELFYFLPVTPIGYNISRLEDSDILSPTEQMINSLLINCMNEFKILEKSIDLHNKAINDNDIKSGFLNLWSIVEILCASSSISDIEKIVSSVLHKDYYNYIFENIANNLVTVLSNDDYLFLISSIIEFEDDTKKIAGFLLLKKYESLRNKYYSKLELYPVLRTRIYEISKLGNSKRKLFQRSEKYKQGVIWNIYRIYRARNAIVHSGESPNNLKLLGECLHTYVDSLMLEVIGKLSLKKELRTIENVLIDTNFVLMHFYEEFSKDGLVDEKTIIKITNSLF